MPFDGTDFRTTTISSPVRANPNVVKVRELLARLPDNLFDMAKPNTSEECDTPACILGWAKTIALINGDRMHTSDIVKWMGLTNQQAADLFCMYMADGADLIDPTHIPGAPFHRATRTQAIRVLDHLIATGEVDWSRA